MDPNTSLSPGNNIIRKTRRFPYLGIPDPNRYWRGVQSCSQVAVLKFELS